jgi:hypothetical protein
MGGAGYAVNVFRAITVAALVLLTACDKPAEIRPSKPSMDAAASIAMLANATDRLDFSTATRVINDAKSLEGIERKAFTDELLKLWALPVPLATELEATSIRLEIANYLLQQTKNRYVLGDTAPYLAYARDMASNGAPPYLDKALMVLVIGGEARDLPTLREHVNDENKWVADTAAFGLAQSCHLSESDAEKVRRSILQPKQRAYFDDAWRNLATMRQHCP